VLEYVVGRDRFELSTYGLKVRLKWGISALIYIL
jgi:hypothetical protein